MQGSRKLTLITGGSGSGKSAFAEGMLDDYQGEKVYIATMQVYGEEGKRKVLRHRKLREGKGFSTIECQTDIGTVAGEVCGKAVLLECIMNLVANEMFSKELSPLENQCDRRDDVVNKITNGISEIVSAADEVVIVTGIVSEDGIDYGADTTEYIEVLNKVNQYIASIADNVYEVVCGIGNRLTQDSNGECSNMILYIGGFGEGKYSYVSSKYKDGVIVNKLNDKIKDWMKSGKDPYQMIEELLASEPQYIICDEIGNGIVPTDSFDREYRETVGRIVTMIAKKADEVYRLICGVEQRIK